MDVDAMTERALMLRRTYAHRYAFPMWAAHWLYADDNAPDLLKEAYVLHFDNEDQDVVAALATEREPTNLAMNRDYKENVLKQFFGYRKGRYSVTSPIIAIACETPFCPIPAPGQSNALSPPSEVDYINVVNLIPFAFDNPSQPDQKRFRPGGRLDKNALVDAYVRTWYLGLYACAFWLHPDPNVEKFFVYKPIGSRHFKPPEMSEEQFLAESENWINEAHDILQQIYGPTNIIIRRMKGKMEGNNATCITDYREAYDRTLFVNSWDPWSVVGNGNAEDRSMDGAFGSRTAMAVIATPLVNDQMQIEAVETIG